jgi:3-methyl-2-oxobutanoate hydroxymethyltransferase
VGLPHGGWGSLQGRPLATAEDYLRAAFHYAAFGRDAYYCAASYDIQKVLCENPIPVVGYIGPIPRYVSWTGWRAVGKTADEAEALWRHTQVLEKIGVFAAELKVVPDCVGKVLSENSSIIMLGMGAGKYADAQYRFTEDVCGYGKNRKPRHGKIYRNLGPEMQRLQNERIAAFKDYKADMDSSGYPAADHSVAIKDDEFDAFLQSVKG